MQMRSLNNRACRGRFRRIGREKPCQMFPKVVSRHVIRGSLLPSKQPFNDRDTLVDLQDAVACGRGYAVDLRPARDGALACFAVLY